MLENRRHLRIRQPIEVRWSMPAKDITGHGRILNISSSGILLQVDSDSRISDESIFFIAPEVDLEHKSPFASRKGKVVWFRKIQNQTYNYQCGVEFFRDEDISNDLEQWLREKTEEISQAMDANILNNYMN